MTTSAPPVLLGPGEGESTHERFHVKAGLDELVVTEFNHDGTDAFATPPHVHYRHADAFYVLEGEMIFHFAGDEHTLGAGEFIFAPPDLVHGFRSAPSGPARMLNFHAPGMGFAKRLLGDGSFEFDQYDPPDDGSRPADEGRIGRASAERLQLGEAEALVLFGGDDGIGSMAIIELSLPAGYDGPLPHLHDEMIDSFYVLEGEIAVLLGDETHAASAGSYALVPPGNVHTFRNPGNAPARVLNIQSPGGLEGYLREVARVGPEAANPEAMAQIASKYDFRVA
jgi:quercetin dioxygenase-like cupin family protein